MALDSDTRVERAVAALAIQIAPERIGRPQLLHGGWGDEGDRCEVSGGGIQQRFGTRGRYRYRDGYGSLDCCIQTFGRDPYPGEREQCEPRR